MDPSWPTSRVSNSTKEALLPPIFFVLNDRADQDLQSRRHFVNTFGRLALQTSSYVKKCHFFWTFLHIFLLRSGPRWTCDILLWRSWQDLSNDTTIYSLYCYHEAVQRKNSEKIGHFSALVHSHKGSSCGPVGATVALLGLWTYYRTNNIKYTW